jgi:predicted RNA-binding Zn-ribbon protein involved in translation (DUF1610 family)
MAKPACPNCGNEDKVVPIIYGLTTPEMAEKVAKGEIRIGGYAVGVDKANWACNNCGHVWA